MILKDESEQYQQVYAEIFATEARNANVQADTVDKVKEKVTAQA
jgi:hypothetical protein